MLTIRCQKSTFVHIATCSFPDFQGKKLPANIDPDAEEGDVSDEDTGDEEEEEAGTQAN